MLLSEAAWQQTTIRRQNIFWTAGADKNFIYANAQIVNNEVWLYVR